MNKNQKACLAWTLFLILLVILSGSFVPKGPTVHASPSLTSNGVGSALCNLKKSATNPVLKPGITGLWDSAGVWDPAVVNAGGNYKMYYSGSDGVNPERIGLATSLNGNSWTKFGAGPVAGALSSCDTNGARTGTVLYTGGEYKMWYQGQGADNEWRVCYASSPDGVNWTGRAEPAIEHGPQGSWDAAWVRFPTVVLDGGLYHMWFTGSDQATNRIGHATSSDGLTWTKDAGPVLTNGAIAAWDWIGVYAPSVAKVGGDFVMLDTGQALPPKWTIGYTRSADGVNWEKSSRVIAQGGTDEFDEFSADTPMVLVEGNKVRIWYSGLPASEFFEIGYAEAELCSGAAPAGPLAYLPAVQRGRPTYYTDDFSDNQSGWLETSDAEFQIGYLNGEYQVWVKTPGKVTAPTSGMKAESYVVEVKAYRVSGNTAAYGFVFGENHSRQLDFYMFVVRETKFSIYHYKNSSWIIVQGWTISPYINTGTAWNTLKLVMPPDGLARAYCNNSLLWSAAEPATGEGIEVSLAALAPVDGDADVRFDNVTMVPYGETPGFSPAGPGTTGLQGARFSPAIARNGNSPASILELPGPELTR